MGSNEPVENIPSFGKNVALLRTTIHRFDSPENKSQTFLTEHGMAFHRLSGLLPADLSSWSATWQIRNVRPMAAMSSELCDSIELFICTEPAASVKSVVESCITPSVQCGCNDKSPQTPNTALMTSSDLGGCLWFRHFAQWAVGGWLQVWNDGN